MVGTGTDSVMVGTGTDGVTVAPWTAVAALLDRLYDDASLFPPARLALPEALAEHERHRRVHTLATGPFVVPPQLVPDVPEGIALAVSGRAAELAHDPGLQRVDVVSVEASGPLDEALGVLADRQGYVEVALRNADDVERGLDALLAAGVPAKFRTGGTDTDAFPSAAALGLGIAGCVARRLPFKLTAGLHDPARHRDPATGVEHHGLLNIVLAVDVSLTGGTVADVVAVLDDHDEPALVDAAVRLDLAGVRRVRRLFRSVGTCSIDECLDGLRRVGLA